MQQLWFPGHLLLRGNIYSGVTWYGCFFSLKTACLHLAQSNWQVLLISSPLGSQQNKQTWPPALFICRCALSFSQMDLSCLPLAASGSEPHSVHATHTRTHTHINIDCQSPIETRDTTETNMSVPQAWAAIILSRKLLWCEEKTTASAYWFWQSVRWMVPNVCLYNQIDALEFVKRETEWFMVMMFNSSCIKPSQSSSYCIL